MKKPKLKKKYLYDFIDNLWFAPSDNLIRSVETAILASQKVEKPSLDIGTGDGKNSKYMLYMHKPIDVGIDMEESVIKEAKKSGIYKEVYTMDATNMSFKSNSFNTVICNSTLEHAPDDKGAIKEISRILRKDGQLFLTVPTVRFEDMLKSIGVKEKDLKTYNNRVAHFRYRTLDDWTKILQKNGLKVEYHLYYFPPNTVKFWYILYKIVIFKPYKRELWSYLKDSPYGKLVPKSVLIPLMKIFLFPYYKRSIDPEGGWVFIKASKFS